MKIWISAAVLTIAWKAIEGVVSYAEGTFSLWQMKTKGQGAKINFHGWWKWQHLPMSFLTNWSATWGGVLIFPFFNAIVAPYLPWKDSPWEIAPALLLGGAIALNCYISWGPHKENFGHVFIDRGSGSWKGNTAMAGWIFFVVMSAQIAMIWEYFLTPMPYDATLLASMLLSVFVIVQQAQAVLVQNGKVSTAFLAAAVQMIAIWVIYVVKIDRGLELLRLFGLG